MLDLIDFSILIAIIGLAFGICLESNLAHGESFQSKIIAVLNLAYWPLFGEIEKVLNKIEIESNCTGMIENECMGIFTHASSYILLMIYMVIGAILLLNLLIAIFRFLI